MSCARLLLHYDETQESRPAHFKIKNDTMAIFGFLGVRQEFFGISDVHFTEREKKVLSDWNPHLLQLATLPEPARHI